MSDRAAGATAPAGVDPRKGQAIAGRSIRFLACAAAAAVIGAGPGAGAEPGDARRPNVIFILVDDLGWSELGCYGNTFNETPHLDTLARQGMRFTQAYAAAPVCSPYRAALMSGQYPARIGVTDYLRPDSAWHLPEDLVTLPELFRNAGYATGIIGKWHLSGYDKSGVKSGPGRHGFDEVMISEQTGIGGGSYFHPYVRVDRRIQPVLGNGEYLTDRINHEAVQFIERNRAKPFFLFVSHYAIHTALSGKPDLVKHFQSRPGGGRTNGNPVLAAMLKSVDEGVGMIVSKLDSLGLTDHTVVVFTGDNGGECNVTRNAPLRAGKSCTYEGGIREPLLVKWPGLTEPGSVCATPTMNIDFYPSFAEATGAEAPASQRVDGRSLLPLLQGKAVEDRPLYWHYPLAQPHFLGGRSSGAIRKGEWKLVEFFDKRELELYRIATDVGERSNVAGQNAEVVRELHRLLADWRQDVGARLPNGQAYPQPQ